MKRFAAIVFVLFGSLTGVAQESSAHHTDDGNRLLPMCQATLTSLDSATWKDAHESFNVGFCYGLIEGVTMASPLVCPAFGVTLHQEVRVVVKFLEDNPELLSRDESALAIKALSKAFPCPKH